MQDTTKKSLTVDTHKGKNKLDGTELFGQADFL